MKKVVITFILLILSCSSHAIYRGKVTGLSSWATEGSGGYEIYVTLDLENGNFDGDTDCGVPIPTGGNLRYKRIKLISNPSINSNYTSGENESAAKVQYYLERTKSIYGILMLAYTLQQDIQIRCREGGVIGSVSLCPSDDDCLGGPDLVLQ